MPFHLDDEQQMIKRVVSDLVDKTVRPAAEEVDRERRPPEEALAGIREIDLTGMLVSSEYGGGADTVTFCVAVEELAKGCASTAALMGVTNTLAALPLDLLGTDDQQEEWLAPLAAGEALGSFALTEPNAGADVSSLDTKLVEDGDGWRLRGQKAWILGAPLADVLLVVARGPEGPTTVIVPADREGIEAGPPERLLGLHGAQTGPLYLEDVPVTEADVLGDPGEGLDQLAEPLRVSRLAIAACATGLLEASLAASQDFADQREQFDEPIRNFQAIQNRLAGLKTAASTARSLTLRAADRRDEGQPFSSQASEAKWRATEEAREHTRSAIRLHGGTGYMREAHVERFYRDARTLTIMGGPNQLHRQRVVERMY
jgi:alkylation response protein AidB-like acyl-CoA dehydrogenase